MEPENKNRLPLKKEYSLPARTKILSFLLMFFGIITFILASMIYLSRLISSKFASYMYINFEFFIICISFFAVILGIKIRSNGNLSIIYKAIGCVFLIVILAITVLLILFFLGTGGGHI